ncbi:MAG: hypothetical protein NC115_00505 [Bacteroidales bacterium]|nr:hypothetical protein [Bacteroidales bacterium]
MKRLFYLFAASAALLSVLVSCKEEKQPRVEGLVVSAKATLGQTVVEGTVDNVRHTVEFLITDMEADPASAVVSVAFADGAVYDAALESFKADLTKMTKFTVNDRYDDVDYVILPAKQIRKAAVNKDKVTLILGTDNDLTYPRGRIQDNNVKLEYMFDGSESLDTQTQKYISYKYFGMILNPNDAGVVVPQSIIDGKYSGAPVFDLGEVTSLSKLVFHPHWLPTQNNGYVGKIEIYAYKGDGEIEASYGEASREFVATDPAVGDWSNWELVGTIDDNYRDITSLDGVNLLSEIEFAYDAVPASRYWRLKVWNIAIAKANVQEAWWYRWTFGEIDIEKYTVVDYAE